MIETKEVVGIVVGLLLMGILLPIGLDSITAFTSTDDNIQTLVATVIPIVAVIGIIMYLLKFKK